MSMKWTNKLLKMQDALEIRKVRLDKKVVAADAKVAVTEQGLSMPRLVIAVDFEDDSPSIDAQRNLVLEPEEGYLEHGGVAMSDAEIDIHVSKQMDWLEQEVELSLKFVVTWRDGDEQHKMVLRGNEIEIDLPDWGGGLPGLIGGLLG